MRTEQKSVRRNALTAALADTDPREHERVPVSSGSIVDVNGERMRVVLVDEGTAYISRSSKQDTKVDMKVPCDMLERAVAQLQHVNVGWN